MQITFDSIPMKNRSITAAIMLAACAATAPSHAQDTTVARAPAPNDEIPFAPFGTTSRFSIGWPRGAMHEGDVAVPVHLWSRTSNIEHIAERGAKFIPQDCFLGEDVLNLLTAGSGRRDVMAPGCTFTFMPHFTFRQVKGGSAPVVTPTFNPGMEFNGFVLGMDRDRTERGLLSRDARSILSMFQLIGLGARDQDLTGTLAAVHVRLAHYSNGQSGCLYTTQVYDAAGDSCSGPAGGPLDLNTRDGSFSTHYIELGATVAPMAFDPDGVERRSVSAGYTVRSYPGGWASGIGGMSSELARAYGRWEFGGNVALRWRDPATRGTWRTVRTLRSEGACAYRRDERYQPCRGSVEAMVSLPAMYGFGISARYLAGWDPYNIAFGREAGVPRSGFPVIALVFDHSRAVTLSRVGRQREAR